MTFFDIVNQVLKFYPHFACSERRRIFPIKYGDLYICGRGVRKLAVSNIDIVIIVAYEHKLRRAITLVKYNIIRPKVNQVI